MSGNSYHCIYCNSRVAALYTQYAEEIIKMEHCPRCGNVSDKYIEYDLFLVIIDLLIGRLEAYRHVIHNVSIPSLLKILSMSILLNAFVSWLSEQPKTENNLANLSFSFSSDLFIHIVSISWWCSCFCLTIVFLFTITKITTVSELIKVLLIVNLSRLLTFFLITWKTEFDSFFVGTLQFYPFVSTCVALTPCIQSLRAVNNLNLTTAFCLGTFICAVSFLSSTVVLPNILMFL
ncbi:unnamed protein product [Schistosoma guineensis]|nr:unnamed protein product [Schistosoma guineensis]